MQLRNASDPENKGRAVRLSADEAAQEFHDDLMAKFNCDVHGMCGQNEGEKGWVPPWADLDPKSAEYACLVHGQCGQTTDTEDTKAWGKTWVPEWSKLDPQSPEYNCQVYGRDCGQTHESKGPVVVISPPPARPPAPPIPSMMDINSGEFRCKVHGDCGDAPTKAAKAAAHAAEETSEVTEVAAAAARAAAKAAIDEATARSQQASKAARDRATAPNGQVPGRAR